MIALKKNEQTDARFAPAYGVSEAARHLGIPRSTLWSWTSRIQYGGEKDVEGSHS